MKLIACKNASDFFRSIGLRSSCAGGSGVYTIIQRLEASKGLKYLLELVVKVNLHFFVSLSRYCYALRIQIAKIFMD